MSYLENKVGIPEANIYNPINYQILYETLDNYCSEKTSTDTDQIIKNIIKQKIAGLPEGKDKKLAALSELFATYKQHILQIQEKSETTDDFCQKKYIDYALIDEVKKDFIAILDTADLNSTQNSILENTNRKDDSIL